MVSARRLYKKNEKVETGSNLYTYLSDCVSTTTKDYDQTCDNACKAITGNSGGAFKTNAQIKACECLQSQEYTRCTRGVCDDDSQYHCVCWNKGEECMNK